MGTCAAFQLNLRPRHDCSVENVTNKAKIAPGGGGAFGGTHNTRLEWSGWWLEGYTIMLYREP